MTSVHSAHANPAGRQRGHAGRLPAVTAMILDAYRAPPTPGTVPSIVADAPVWSSSVPITLRTTHLPHQAL